MGMLNGYKIKFKNILTWYYMGWHTTIVTIFIYKWSCWKIKKKKKFFHAIPNVNSNLPASTTIWDESLILGICDGIDNGGTDTENSKCGLNGFRFFGTGLGIDLEVCGGTTGFTGFGLGICGTEKCFEFISFGNGVDFRALNPNDGDPECGLGETVFGFGWWCWWWCKCR